MSHEDGNIQGNLGPREGSADDPTQPMEAAIPGGGQSRRVFLRNAVIGSAAAAAAVGVGATIAATTPVGPKLLGKVAAFNSLTSPTDPYAICFEETALDGSALTSISINSQGDANGRFWLIYTARALPASQHYTLYVTQTVNSTTTDVTGSSTPFAWQESTTVSGNLYVGDGTSVLDCPKTSVNGSGNNNYNDDVSVTDGQTIQWAVHLQWVGGTIGAPGTHETATFTAVLMNNGSPVSGSSRTTATITITQN